jgi:hypothetical protein
MKHERFLEVVGIVALILGLVTGIYTIATDLKQGLLFIAVGVALAIAFFLLKRGEPYQVRLLIYSVDIDIASKDALAVNQTRTYKIKALKSNVTKFVEHMSADGKMTSPTVDIGTIESIKTEGGDVFVHSNFGKPLAKGEEINRTLKLTLQDSFNGQKEYWGIRISHPTEAAQLTVRFPKDRPFKTYCGFVRMTTHEHVCDKQPEVRIIDSRQCLVWSILKPQLGEVYKVEWEW